MRQVVTFLLSVRFAVPFLLLLTAVGATLSDFQQEQQYACAVTCGPASQITNTWSPSHTPVDTPLMVPFANSTSSDLSRNSSDSTNETHAQSLRKQSGAYSGSSNFRNAVRRTSTYFARTFQLNNGYRADGMKSLILRTNAILEREPTARNFAPEGLERSHTLRNTLQKPLKRTSQKSSKMSGGFGVFLA